MEPIAGRDADATRELGVRGRVRRLLANHPKATDRVTALRDPQSVTSISAVDGFTVGFFTAIALPLVDQALNPLLSAMGRVSWGGAITSGLLGPFVGATLGLGLWRQAVLTRVGGRPAQLWPIAAAVFVGTVLGQAASLAAAGTGSVTAGEHVQSSLLIAVAMTGATVLTAGLGAVP